jgi:hypothetical protein
MGTRPNVPQEDIDIILRLFEKGEKVSYIAEITGFHRWTIVDHAHKNGLKRPRYFRPTPDADD